MIRTILPLPTGERDRVRGREDDRFEGIESIQEAVLMVNRKKVLDEIFELALQNDMKYFG